MLTNKQAISKIKKVYNERFEKFEELYEWYGDIEREDVYGWHFLNNFGSTVFILCNKKTGAVKVEIR